MEEIVEGANALRVFAVREEGIVNRFVCPAPTISSRKSRRIMV